MRADRGIDHRRLSREGYLLGYDQHRSYLRLAHALEGDVESRNSPEQWWFRTRVGRQPAAPTIPEWQILLN